MIYRIYSSLPNFKTLSLHEGFNALVVRVHPGASDRQTRNRAGKSSVTEIISFLLGADTDPGTLFRTKALEAATFGMEFDLKGTPTRVERSGAAPSKIRILEGDTSAWPIQPKADRKTGVPTISRDNWRLVLGEMMFGLPDVKSAGGRFGPTFRSLIAYFVRRQSAGAFVKFMAQAHMQQLWDQQVAISYLIGLDWGIPQQLQAVRERERAIRQLGIAAKDGAFGELISSTAELRTDLTVAESRLERLRRNIGEFRILPEYRRFEAEASSATRELADQANGNALDRHLIHELSAAIQAEEPPSEMNLEALYAEAGVVIPTMIAARFDSVREFHESVVRNRRSYLEGELTAARQRVAERERQMAEIDRRRSEIMRTLRSHGALESYSQMQGELSRLEAQTETLRQRFAAAEQLEGQKSELEIDRQRILRRLQQDYREQSELLRDAILVFESISQSLYEDAGQLTIDHSANGPVFDVRIQGVRSKGITNMQIFCFDMMLMQLASVRGLGPGFLVHDSHLFDGVDSRQIAHAFEAGARLAEKHGFQYFVTMNSDDIPASFPEGFDFQSHLVPANVTDASEDGGLFGFRF